MGTLLFSKLLAFSVLLVNVFASTGTFNTKIGPKPIWNLTATDRLKHDLLLNYDKFARPAQHYNTTVVTVGLTIRHIDLNEYKAMLTVNSWFRMSWKDEKLKWNSTDYEGLATLHLADHEIWQPDIVLYNSAAGSTVDHYGNTHCLVHEDGTVLWVPPSQFMVFCTLDMRLWPFDSQQCLLTLGSWTYDGNQINIELDDNDKNFGGLELVVNNTEWTITGVTKIKNTKYYACCEEPYTDVTYTINMKRNSPTYNALIITPVFTIIIMTLVNFWLPPQAGEKILLNGCNLIIISIFLLYFTYRCPMMGDHTPLVVLFYSTSLYVVTFSLIGSVFVIWLSRVPHTKSIPWPIKHALTGWLGRWLGLENYITQTSISGAHRANAEELRDQQSSGGVFDEGTGSGEEHHMISPSPRTPPAARQDWLLLAAACDRLAFIFYSLLFIILAITYSV